MTVWTNAVPSRRFVAVIACVFVRSRWPRGWFALVPADVAPPAAVGDVAEFGHIDVDQRAGMVMLVAADGFAGDPVDTA